VEGDPVSEVPAYKFLHPGGVGPFSRFKWPAPAGDEPGEWVDSRDWRDLCQGGIHACRTSDLPWWIREELWLVELDGEVEAHQHKLRAQRGRLVRQVEDWTPETALEFTEACAKRVKDIAARTPDGSDVGELVRAMIGDAEANVEAARGGATPAGRTAATCSYISSLAALRTGGPEAFAAERAWQAEWLAGRLGLDAG
jgi:hypothetical protein